MEISSHLSAPFDTSLEELLSELPPCSGTPSRWTLWVSGEIRHWFDERKEALAPGKTHGVFVELLLVYRNKMARNGILPLFVPQKEVIPRRFVTERFLDSGFSQPHPPVLLDNYRLGNNSTMMDQPTTINPGLTFGQDSSSTSSVVSEKKVRRKSLSVRTKDFLGPYEKLKKYRYSHETKPPISPFAFPSYHSSTTLTNLNDDLNGLQIMFAPTQENFPVLSSFDSFEVSQLSSDFMMSVEPMMPFDPTLQQLDTYPDMGPFYQPLNYGFGELTPSHEYGLRLM